MTRWFITFKSRVHDRVFTSMARNFYLRICTNHSNFIDDGSFNGNNMMERILYGVIIIVDFCDVCLSRNNKRNFCCRWCCFSLSVAVVGLKRIVWFNILIIDRQNGFFASIPPIYGPVLISACVSFGNSAPDTMA